MDSEAVSKTFTVSCAAPEIEPAETEFITSVPVELSTTTPGATIYYTLYAPDGTQLGERTAYTGPFELERSARVEAVTVKV